MNAQRASEQRVALGAVRREERRDRRAQEKRKRLERASRARSAPTPYAPAIPSGVCWFSEHVPDAGPCSGGLVRCHLIDQALLAREFRHGFDGRSSAVLQADSRGWVWGCGGNTGLEGHHGRLDFAAHDSTRLLIPRALLPEGAEAMAEELGLLWWLSRTYGEAPCL